MKSKTRDKSGLKKVSSNEDKKQAKKIHQASKSTQYPREMGHHGTDPETTLNPEEWSVHGKRNRAQQCILQLTTVEASMLDNDLAVGLNQTCVISISRNRRRIIQII